MKVPTLVRRAKLVLRANPVAPSQAPIPRRGRINQGAIPPLSKQYVVSISETSNKMIILKKEGFQQIEKIEITKRTDKI